VGRIERMGGLRNTYCHVVCVTVDGVWIGE
jgi:hypothetical protein